MTDRQRQAYLDFKRVPFEKLIESIETKDVIAIDTETNGEDVRDGTGLLHGLSFCALNSSNEFIAGYYSLNDPLSPSTLGNITQEQKYLLKNSIENYSGFLIFHNAKFDLESLRTVGIDYQGNFYDTMIMCHLINETMPYSKSLDDCVKYYLSLEGKKKSKEFELALKAFGWSGMPSHIMEEYAEYDTVLTYALWEKIYPLAKKEGILDERLLES